METSQLDTGFDTEPDAARPRDWTLVAIIGGALLVRLAWSWYGSRGAPTFENLGDQYSYWIYGQEIAAGRGYSSYTGGEPTAYYPIGFPALLAVVFFLTDAFGLSSFDMTAVVLLQVALGVVAVWLVYLIADSIIGRRTALVAASITAVFPNLVFGSTTVSLESAFIAAYLGAVAILVRHRWSDAPASTSRLVAFGIVLGLSAQIRPFSAPMIVAVAVAALVAGWGWTVALRQFAIALACMLAVFVPWTVRNAVVLDAFVPTSTNLGDGLCMSRFPGSSGGFSWADHDYCVDPSTPAVDRNWPNTKMALTFVRDHPTEELRLIGARFVLMMESDHSALDDTVTNWGFGSAADRLAVLARSADLFYFGVLALAIPGTWKLARDRPNPPQLAVLVVVALVLFVIPLLLWGNPRFKIPLLPLMAIPAAAGAVWIWDAATRRMAANRAVTAPSGP